MLALPLALLIAAPLALGPETKLWIDGDSSMHAWTCTAERMETTSDVSPAKAGEVPAVRSLSVPVQVKDLKCGNGTMEDKLRDALHDKKTPRIEYALTSIEPLPGAVGGAQKLKAQGQLTVAGKTRSVTMVVSASVQPDGTVVAKGALPLLMTDFGVDPPSAMLGLMKTADRVWVKFELHTRATLPAKVSGPHAALSR